MVNSKFKYNRTGMEIIAPIPNLPVYFINFIYKNSAAERAGLKEGDQLTHINSYKVTGLKLDDVYAILQKNNRSKMHVRVLRGQNEIHTTLILGKGI